MRKISHQFPSGSRTRYRGYTMIELLTVTAIIILLAGLLIPVVNRARAKARATFCVNNLRQWGAAFLLYAGDENGFLPSEGNVGAGVTAPNAWYNALPPYFNKKRYMDIPPPRVNFVPDLDVWSCPEKYRLRPFSTSTNNSVFYAMNDLLDGEWTGATEGSTSRHTRVGSLPAPAATVLLFDIFAHDTRGNPMLSTGALGNRNPYRDLHQSGCNFLFVDGHVEWFPKGAFWSGSAGITNHSGLRWWP